MATTREKGKIPRGEWPDIAARHRAGDSFASIARSYGCTAPAIRYIINRASKEKHGKAVQDVAAAGARGAEEAHLQPGNRIEAVEPQRSPRAARPRKAIDQRLRDRVNSDIAAFLVAFDLAFERESVENFQALLAATDRLLRAGAWTRIALAQTMQLPESAAPSREKHDPATEFPGRG